MSESLVCHGHSKFTLVNGLRTHAWVCGTGEPLVIVPGLGCASWMYHRLSRELGRERTVYAYDPPGHGDSQGLPHRSETVEGLTDHLANWLELNELLSAPVLGHSLGGEICFDLAARYPELPAALIACAPTGVPENPQVLEQCFRMLRDLPRERPGLLLPGLRSYWRCGFRRMVRLAAAQSTHNVGIRLPQVKCPTLLLNGTSDAVIQRWTVKTIQAHIPGAIIREIQGAPHALTDSHPRAVARYTLDFLNGLGR